MLERDQHTCQLALPGCLVVATVADHRANRGAGGAGKTLDAPSNLVAACGLCNGRKESGAFRAELIRRGLRVASGRTHAHTAERARALPVTRLDGRAYYLKDDGSVVPADH